MAVVAVAYALVSDVVSDMKSAVHIVASWVEYSRETADREEIEAPQGDKRKAAVPLVHWLRSS